MSTYHINDSEMKIEKEGEADLFLDFNDFRDKYLEISTKEIENDIGFTKEHSNQESLIIKLESEFYFIEQEQKAIFSSNEEMMKYSNGEDEDINECRSENMKLMFKNFERMKEIQKEILQIDCSHNIRNIDLLALTGKNNQDVDYKDPKNNPLIVEFIDRSAENGGVNDAEFNQDFNNFFNLDTGKKSSNCNEDKVLQEIDL